MASSKRPRVTISRTPSEWKIIDDKLAELKRANFNSYLRGRVHSLVKEYKKSHKEVCESIEKRMNKREAIPPDDLKILEVISMKTGVAISQIVNQIIVEPLLRSNGKQD